MRAPVPEREAGAEANALRTQLVGSVAEAIRRGASESKRQRSQQSLWWAAAAAAVFAVGGAGYVLNAESGEEVASQAERANLRQVVGKVVVTLPDGSDRMVTSDTQLASGEEVSTTARAFASLELEDQARVDLSSATTVKLDRVLTRDHAFVLQSGRVDVNVPKIAGEPRQLTVRTADTLVSVRGTIFSVEVSEKDERSVTTVQVSRGSVAVASGGEQIVLPSGERWSSSSVAASEKVEPSVPPQAAATPEKPVLAPSLTIERSPLKPSVSSSLARQNKLFEQGLQARDRGDDKKATYWFERLMKEFPTSPLLPSAKAEHLKATERLSK